MYEHMGPILHVPHPLFLLSLIVPTVANSQLRGSSDLDAALVLQYVNFADFEVLPAVCTWTFPTLGIMQPNQQVYVFIHVCTSYCVKAILYTNSWNMDMHACRHECACTEVRVCVYCENLMCTVNTKVLGRPGPKDIVEMVIGQTLP